MSNTAKVWIDGLWMDSHGSETFSAVDPSTGKSIGDSFPVSDWMDCERALAAADAVSQIISEVPRDRIAKFLEAYATAIEQDSVGLAELAHQETGLPITPRLKDVELPRTVNQLRQAAAACREGSWGLPTIDTKAGIRSVHAAIGPVLVIGPNNFPFAFNGISGGDFAAAIAAGNPVIAKGHPSHPGTTLRLAGLASKALAESGLPSAMVQLIHRMPGEVGLRMIGDHRLASVGFTGSKSAGLKIKQVCDEHGKPVYLEMSSINPVLILPAVLEQRGTDLAQEFSGSCLMGAGQFCTNPGLIILVGEANSQLFLSAVKDKFSAAPAGTLLSRQVLDSVISGITKVHAAGAELLTGGGAVTDNGRLAIENSLLHVSGSKFLENPMAFQTEMFGPVSLIVTASDVEQARVILQRLEGNLTGCIYSSPDGSDDAAYARLAPLLRQRVGRLLNDKMPTGVAVSAAMNHGGPFPATGHPGFTAVGIPASLRRFSALHCYDNVRSERLPMILQDSNPSQAWRLVDGQWTR